MKNDKYEFLYEYARLSFEDELTRFRNIEEKSTKYLSILSVVITAFTIVLRFLSELFIPPNDFLSWLTCFAIFLTYAALLSSWSLLFRSLRPLQMPRLPISNKFQTDFEQRSLVTNHFALSKTCFNAATEARKVTEFKITLLNLAYRDIALSMWALIVSLLFIFFSSIPSEG